MLRTLIQARAYILRLKREIGAKKTLIRNMTTQLQEVWAEGTASLEASVGEGWDDDQEGWQEDPESSR